MNDLLTQVAANWQAYVQFVPVALSIACAVWSITKIKKGKPAVANYYMLVAIFLALL